ncbi:MAG TPA: nickel-dependent lactate racemase [bacterium]|nr:nickel-dependent lactate racemase [bacterium]HPN45369.1 nickel-dependent lactate racemase [bacterium]
MQIELAYGKTGLAVEVPDANLAQVLTMSNPIPITDTYIEITKSLLRPIGIDRTLFDMAKNRSSACILICDITRPVPNRIILPPILKTLHAAGLKYEDILILIATGIHRPNLDDELTELVGEEIKSKYRIENHYSGDLDSHKYLGKTTRGADIWLDKRFVEADLKIATGFIEPHLMAGFSGGRKLIVPGIAGIETMKHMHGAEMLAHPNAREGIIEGNPFHEEALEIANIAGVDFIVNVALNEKKEICGIFSGDLNKAHLAGVEFVYSSVRDTVPKPVDVVITTSAGYPLDTTFYQAIKGLTAALPIVKKGGTIIIAAECSQGIGSQDFTRLITETQNLDVFVHKILHENYFVIDQWQLQEYAKAAKKAKIILVSHGLTQQQKDAIHVPWAESVEAALAGELARLGENARVAVIPRGPYILAEVAH